MRARFDNAADKNDAAMPLTMKNYILLLAGFAVIVLGMALMCGGGSDDPDEYGGGFAFEIFALMKRF